MIITRYLIKETFFSQLIILSILLLIFFCQKLVRTLSAAANGEIPTNIVFSLLGLCIPEIMKFILPLSLFLSLLMTFSKLFAEREISAIFACGLSKLILIRVAMVLAFFTGIILLINIMWIIPWTSHHQDKVIIETKLNPDMMSLTQGQFQQIFNDNSILFVENIDGDRFYDVFLAKLRSKDDNHPSVIIVAESGQFIQNKDGSKVIRLNKGMRFEGTAMLHNFCITSFQNYQAKIENREFISDLKDTDKMNIHTLWNTDSTLARAELHWRVTLFFIVFIMALLVVPLSIIDSSRGRILPILIAMLFYIMFFLLQTSIKHNTENERIDSVLLMWLMNGMYLLIAIILNVWNTTLIRRIRINFLRINKIGQNNASI